MFEFEPTHKRAGVGILVDVNSRGKGYAREALELLEDYCFNHLHFKQIYANIGIDNTISSKLFESLGYQKVGIKKDWIKTSSGFVDEMLYQKIKK